MSTQFRCFCLLLLFGLVATGARSGAQQASMTPDELRQFEHDNPMWPTIQEHLPDPATASAEKLETAGDVLRARRFLQGALDYYMYAVHRGGKEVPLLNKIGVTELELGRISLAREFFQRVVKLKKKNSEGWNNLGAVEYIQGEYRSAISDYNRAIKLDKKAASYHSNLATAYLEQKDYAGARKQYGIALTLDPDIFDHRGTGGVAAHMLTTEDHARFCFEVARLYAERDDMVNVLHYLTMASEGGFDVMRAMGDDSVLMHYRKDPRVLLLVQNAKALRNNKASIDAIPSEIPPLPAVQHE